MRARKTEKRGDDGHCLERCDEQWYTWPMTALVVVASAIAAACLCRDATMLAVWAGTGTDRVCGARAGAPGQRRWIASANDVRVRGQRQLTVPRRRPGRRSLLKATTSASTRAPSSVCFPIVSNNRVVSLHTLAVLHG